MTDEKKKIFLTFDMDWATDNVLKSFYRVMHENNLVGTLNVTHKTEMLEVFRADESIELGIHPNYNQLLSGQTGEGTGGAFLQVLSALKRLVPEAVCLRSHALTTSSVITSHYDMYGIKYDLNTWVEPMKGMCLKSYDGPNGNYRILPFIFEDDIWLTKGKKIADYYLSEEFDAPRIFNFHPVHLFLNTDCIGTYERAKPYYKDDAKLREFCNQKEYGVRDFFQDLVAAAKKGGWTFCKIKDGDW